MYLGISALRYLRELGIWKNVQVPASWGLTGLDEATVERLYAKVKAQTQAGPPPENLKQTYLSEWLESNVIAGNPIVDDPKV